MSGLKDLGKGWRDEEILWLMDYGVKVFSPPDEEPKLFKKYGVSQSIINERPADFSQDLIMKIFGDVIKKDFKAVKNADFVIVNFTKYSPGTCSEITWAFMHNIPVYLVNNTGEKRLNPWILGGTTKVFGSFNDLHKFLIKKYKLKKINAKKQKSKKYREAA